VIWKPRLIFCARRALPRPPRRLAASLRKALSGLPVVRDDQASSVEGEFGRRISSRATSSSRRWSRSIAGVALTTGGNVDQLKSAAYPGGGTVDEAIANTVATIGENMTLRRTALVSVSSGVIAPYLHNAVGEGLGKIAVLVALELTGNAEALLAIGKQVAMHVAAANPQGLDANSIDPAVVARERAIFDRRRPRLPASRTT